MRTEEVKIEHTLQEHEGGLKASISSNPIGAYYEVTSKLEYLRYTIRNSAVSNIKFVKPIMNPGDNAIHLVKGDKVLICHTPRNRAVGLTMILGRYPGYRFSLSFSAIENIQVVPKKVILRKSSK